MTTTSLSESVAAYLETCRRDVDAELEALLPLAVEDRRPAVIWRAMRYSLHAGGKRVRPALALAAAETCGGDPAAILPAACGLEMIHTYSLVHDDLPALDNDSLRRGRPTSHVVFGEAMAIMAGDALLTEGLRVVARYPLRSGLDPARPQAPSWEARRLEAFSVVVDAISARGMIGGQVADLESTAAGEQAGSAADLEFVHLHKTADLIRASVLLGGILAGARAGDTEHEALAQYGSRLGLLFQIVDDLLDVTGDAATLGKSAGKDAAAAKLTYPALYGVDGTRRHRDELLDAALSAAAPLETPGRGRGLLAGIARFVAGRDR